MTPVILGIQFLLGINTDKENDFGGCVPSDHHKVGKLLTVVENKYKLTEGN